MKIIIDANIIFSAILNTNSKIGDLLINSKQYFDFIAPDFLRTEIRDKHARIAKITKFTIDRVFEAEFQICKDIHFISDEQISAKYWLSAEKLVRDIDPKDIHYVAYAKQFKCKIWSGDKQLSAGLEKKGVNKIITTSELFDLRETLKLRE